MLVPDDSTAPVPPTARDVTQFACPPALVPDGGFVDTAGVFVEEIDCLRWYGITTGGAGGRPANEYGSAVIVTRGQMAGFIVRFADYVNAGLVAAYDGSNRFADVPTDHTHVAAINRLAAAGIVSGGVGGAAPSIYAPDSVVTRNQMASFIARVLGRVVGSDVCVGVDDYFDDDAGNAHEPCINALAGSGIVVGTATRMFSPANPVSRAQMSGFIMRAMDLLVEQQRAAVPAA